VVSESRTFLHLAGEHSFPRRFPTNVHNGREEKLYPSILLNGRGKQEKFIGANVSSALILKSSGVSESTVAEDGFPPKPPLGGAERVEYGPRGRGNTLSEFMFPLRSGQIVNKENNPGC